MALNQAAPAAPAGAAGGSVKEWIKGMTNCKHCGGEHLDLHRDCPDNATDENAQAKANAAEAADESSSAKRAARGSQTQTVKELAVATTASSSSTGQGIAY